MKAYSFKKIDELKWQEIGFWHQSHYVTVLNHCIHLSRKYTNASFIIKHVILKDINLVDGVIYEVDDSGKSEDISIIAKFKNKADEVEFILQESIQ